jgi:diaminohydroxyphosphoribosylaminopyrimidine deaminase / 5-amino-6-(5-phosphoribosylamino)uracil reductase
MNDIKYMKAALKISKRGIGFTEPNPLVGAVVVKDNKILATGYHWQYGSPHAEQVALKEITEPGTTLYVTLEPCIHFGKTPPCTELILQKKVKRVVIALQDPNPNISGKGIQRLRDNGVQVETGMLQGIANKINRHYLTYMTEKRPYVALKAGVSIDCKLTDKYRKSQWVTGEYLRQFSHSFRGEFSAIMAGVQTIIDDNPLLTVRESAWDPKKLIRVVLDSQNRLDRKLNIFYDQGRFPLFLFSSNKATNQETKVQNHFFVNPGESGKGLDLKEVLETLHRQGVASVMVEGGGGLFDSFLKTEFYDEIVFSVADKIIGGQSSVQFFDSGASISEPILLKNREIIPLQSGYIVRGFRR